MPVDRKALLARNTPDECPPLYRFLPKAEYAKDFCEGRLWLSTLEICRKTEDTVRGDSGEGTRLMTIKAAGGGQLNSEELRFARSMGGDSSAFIFNSGLGTVLQDHHLLSLTMDGNLDAMREFGEHCIEITKPKAFMNALTNYLNAKHGLVEGVMAKVAYKERAHDSKEPRPGPIGFVKPESFSKEKEVRMLWADPKRRTALDRVVVDCPALSAHCRIKTF